MRKSQKPHSFCARFVHDRGAALVIRHDLSGDILGGETRDT